MPEKKWIEYSLLAQSQVKKDNLEAATVFYEKAIALNPQNASLYVCLAELKEKKMSYLEAIQLYQKAFEIEPNNIRVYLKICSLCSQSNQLSEFISQRRNKHNTVQKNTAKSLFQDKDGKISAPVTHIALDEEISLLSNLEKKVAKTGISLVTCCMNRNDNLIYSLKTWLKAPQINEIVIVDWNSKLSVQVSLREASIRDERIVLARVINQPKWILTLAYNVGFQLASYDKILKIDVDNQISADFFEKHTLVDQNVFFAGDWQQHKNPYYNGTFYAWKRQLSQVGYFNEYIQSYGWDDTDLYQRFIFSGFIRQLLQEETLGHLEHDDQLRLINQIEEKEESSWLEKYKTIPEYFIQFNRYLTYILPQWNAYSLRQDYKIIHKEIIDDSFFHVVCQSCTSPKTIPQYLVNIVQELALRTTLYFMQKDDTFIWEENSISNLKILNSQNEKCQNSIADKSNMNMKSEDVDKGDLFSNQKWHIIFSFPKVNPFKIILFIDQWLDLTYLFPEQPIIWVYLSEINQHDLYQDQTFIIDYIQHRSDTRLFLLENKSLFEQYQRINIDFESHKKTESQLKFITQNSFSSIKNNLLEIKFLDSFADVNLQDFIEKEFNLVWLLKYVHSKEYLYYQAVRAEQDCQLLIQEYNLQDNSTNSSPLISIVTSIYKGEEFIEGFLKNITQQTIFQHCELLLIDANSPENEQDIINNFTESSNFSNIYYYRLPEDPGLYECWNMAIRKSRGKYITNANLDDRRSPLHLEVLLQYLENAPDKSAVSSALIVTNHPHESWDFFTPESVWFDGMSGEINFDDLYKYKNGLVVSRNTLHCMPLWRKELHDKYGYFDENNYGTSADWEFWLRCSYHGEKFGIIGSPLGLYYLNPDSHNRKNDPDGFYELNIIKKYFSVKQNKIIKQ